MKNQRFQKLLLLITAFTASVFFAQNLWAQATSAGTSKPTPAASASQTVPKLSYGVPQILELSHAKIGNKTIIDYIRNSGVVYRLDASQIIYLKRQGVSEAVIAAMINHRPRASATVAQPATTDVQTVPSSTAYVVPYPQSYYYYSPYSYPYYYPYYGYYGWPYPALSFSFGFGGGHWGGYHGHHHYGGGFHGGGFHGGGFHGGGGHHR